MFNKNFAALLAEASFTKELLGLGATQIRKANYAEQGKYYEAFICLSTGMERISKLCLILDYYISNACSFPPSDVVRKYGHDLIKLYDKSIDIVSRNNINLKYGNPLKNPSSIHYEILHILSDFSKTDRYANINFVLGFEDQPNPIGKWCDIVDRYIYDNLICLSRKRSIQRNARTISQLGESFIQVQHILESGEPITNIEGASMMTGVQEAVAPYRQLFILQIIRYWVEIICELCYKSRRFDQDDIPFLSEVFALFYNSDNYLKSRKTWDKLK